MITLGSIYIITADFDRTLDFYRKLLQREVIAQNKTRFAVFQIDGLCLSIMNGSFDREHSDEVVHREVYSPLYDDTERIMNSANCGKVVINLCTDDLEKEYRRIRELGIGSELTEIRYVNAIKPYWYFLLKDIDGNTVEITGRYEEGEKNESEE